jgi:hypothetical protein
VANKRYPGTGRFCAALALALLVSCSEIKRAETMETNTLNITLQVVKQGAELYGQLRFTNLGKEPFLLERSLSGEEIPAGRQIFRVVNDKGEELAYTGPAEKRSPPVYPDDYVTLQPGAELLTVYPLDQEYRFDSRGQSYKMQYDVINALPEDKGLVFLKSNVAAFTYP